MLRTPSQRRPECRLGRNTSAWCYSIIALVYVLSIVLAPPVRHGTEHSRRTLAQRSDTNCVPVLTHSLCQTRTTKTSYLGLFIKHLLVAQFPTYQLLGYLL